MVALGMGVDQSAYIAGAQWLSIAHRLQHVCCQTQIEQGIDQQGLFAVYDQPGITPTPASVRLEVAVA